MDEYLIKKESLAAIGDEIRILSDLSTAGISPNAMASNLQDANNEVTEQSDLVEQIKTVLASKAAGPILQRKFVTPTPGMQDIRPDNGYDGLSQVIVNNIPSEYMTTVKINSGTCTVDSDEHITVNCGFKPDYVVIHLNEDDENHKYHTAFCFSADVRELGGVYAWLPKKDDSWHVFWAWARDDGFYTSVSHIDPDYQWGSCIGTSFYYIAVKYT